LRSQFPVAVILIFLSDESVLLLRRFNTGWEDGNYSVTAGYVDAGESVIGASIREVREEIGVIITPSELEVEHVMHRKAEDERIDFFSVVKNWAGEINNMEHEKCDDLSWQPLLSLPSNIIPYVKRGLVNFQDGILFSEFGQ